MCYEFSDSIVIRVQRIHGNNLCFIPFQILTEAPEPPPRPGTRTRELDSKYEQRPTWECNSPMGASGIDAPKPEPQRKRKDSPPSRPPPEPPIRHPSQPKPQPKSPHRNGSPHSKAPPKVVVGDESLLPDKDKEQNSKLNDMVVSAVDTTAATNQHLTDVLPRVRRPCYIFLKIFLKIYLCFLSIFFLMFCKAP